MLRTPQEHWRDAIALAACANMRDYLGVKRGIEIAKDLERRAREAGFSRKAICAEAKIAPSTFTRWLSGDNSPTASAIEKIEAIIGRAIVPTAPLGDRRVRLQVDELVTPEQAAAVFKILDGGE